jgi:hypothetical protein
MAKSTQTAPPAGGPVVDPALGIDLLKRLIVRAEDLLAKPKLGVDQTESERQQEWHGQVKNKIRLLQGCIETLETDIEVASRQSGRPGQVPKRATALEVLELLVDIATYKEPPDCKTRVGLAQAHAALLPALRSASNT